VAKKNRKLNCWEFMKCGMEKSRECPAYPAGGRICYMLAGTSCFGKAQGPYKQKSRDCINCDFYKKEILDSIQPGMA
jgi:hypothetical protein